MLERGHTVRGTVRDALDSRKTEHLTLGCAIENGDLTIIHRGCNHQTYGDIIS